MVKLLGPLVTAAALVLATAPVCAADAPFTIDVVLPLTGAASYLGSQEAAALAAYEDYTNKHGGVRGRPIHFDVHDDQTSPQVAVQLLNSIVPRRPAVVLGSTMSADCGAMAAIVEKAGPVMYCFSPALESAKDSFSFAATSTLAQLEAGVVRYAQLRGFKKYAFVTTTDATGLSNDQALQKVFAMPQNDGLQVVSQEHVSATDISYAAQVARIKAARPQAILAQVSGQAFGTLLRNLYYAGVGVPVFTSSGNASPKVLNDYKSFLPPELLIAGLPTQLPLSDLGTSPVRPQVQLFVDGFKGNGTKPGPVAAYAWDPALLVVAGFRKLGLDATAAQIRDFIESQHHFVGANGIYDFGLGDQHGLTNSILLITR